MLGGGSLVGAATAPGAWYEELAKPAFTPPDWVFGPVWSVLYVMVAIVGWRIWRDGSALAMRLWWTQLALNFAWSPLFFVLHWIDAALVVIAAVLVAILSFMLIVWRDDDHVSALLFVLYLAWVAFATILNAAIFWLN
ncbi:MAG: tryptophan-rich sensory protein [Rhizobiaceae bacterium]|nr:tryptophan-rich sensory protein [Rhizobiaceae bacterium]MCV0407941.1 tryptophan-rich sensory protein [Rhizobiaceae bacterium]